MICEFIGDFDQETTGKRALRKVLSFLVNKRNVNKFIVHNDPYILRVIDSVTYDYEILEDKAHADYLIIPIELDAQTRLQAYENGTQLIELSHYMY